MTVHASPCCSFDLPYVPGADPSCPWCEGCGLDLEAWYERQQSKACYYCCAVGYRDPAVDWEEERAELDSDKDGWLDDGPLGAIVVRAHYMGRWLPPEDVTSITMHSGASGGDIANYFANQVQKDGRVVSAHFESRKDGSIRQMVPVGRGSRVAFHNGKRNKPRGTNPGGGAAYGIEHQGPFGKPYSDAQIEATLRIVGALQELCPNLSHLEAHSNTYPKSRRDPGKLFPWERFEGLGLEILR